MHPPLGRECLMGVVVQDSHWARNYWSGTACPHLPLRLQLPVLRPCRKTPHSILPAPSEAVNGQRWLQHREPDYLGKKTKPNGPNGQFHALEFSLALLLWVSKAPYNRYYILDYCSSGMSSFRSSLCPRSWRSKLLLLLPWLCACSWYGHHVHLLTAYRFVLSRTCLSRIGLGKERQVMIATYRRRASNQSC